MEQLEYIKKGGEKLPEIQIPKDKLPIFFSLFFKN